MDDSWSWDGSLVSLHSSMAASTSSNPLSRVGSASNLLNHSISLPPLAALKTDTSASYRPSYRVHTPPAIATRPPSPSSPSTSSFSESAPPAPLVPPSKVSPSLSPRDPPISHTAHPLTSMLLADLSPPASPSPSLSSFPRSGSRSRISSSNASGSRSGRGRTRMRRGSASSTVSTDGSAHGEGEEDSGTSSAEDNGHHHGGGGGGGLVMPSLTLEGGHRRSPARAHQEERKQPEVKLLVMGKTAEDRRTLSTLLVNDHEGGGHHSSGVSDMSYSFLSTGDRSQHARSNSETSQVSGVSDNSLFSKLGCCSSSTALSHTTIDSPDIDLLVTALRRPLEQLESKLNPAYPTTETLTSLVCSAGVGEFDACLFLFSSPPLHCEIVLARAISQVLPILPILILPPSPTSKPQKTSALSNAVIQQLDSAGVRWLPISSFERRESRSPPRAGSNKATDIGGGPLSMLPYDLFVQHPPSHSYPSSRDPTSTPTTSFPSPTSEPTSLTSSQELPPLSPTFTTGSSYRSSSSRASSTRSLSPSSGGRNTANLHRLTLLDLHRLRRIFHSDLAPGKLRRARAETFLEWREVEVAARGIQTIPIEALPQEWQEKGIEKEETDRVERRALDFSKRVAERRKSLHEVVDQEQRDEERRGEDDGDVLDLSDEEEHTDRRQSHSTTQDPTTPKPCYRYLSSSFVPLATPTPESSRGSSSDSSSSPDKPTSATPWSSNARPPSPSYFPPYPRAPLSSSIVSIPSVTSNSSDGSSIALLQTSDPFHLPSLLHLVGLNFRLALFRPSEPPRDSQADSSSSHPSKFARGNGNWWRGIAMFGLVFAAGVVAGIQVVDRFDRAGSAGVLSSR